MAMTLGRVVAVFRYPVKSMCGESIESADVGWHGFAGDRRWAFIRNDAAHSGFPWLTIRERAQMALYRPSFVDPAQPDRSRIRVRTPVGAILDLDDPALGRELWPQGAQLTKQNRGTFDTFPISIISTQTIAAIGNSVGEELEVSRFRPNILLEAVVDTPFAEDSWVGSNLRIGSTRLRVDKRDGRCAVITVDPRTAVSNLAVLRAVVGERQGCLGVYASTIEPGRVAVADSVQIDVGE